MNLSRLYILILVVVACVVYARVVTHEHVLDDLALIPNHPALDAPFDFKEVLLGRYWGDLRAQDSLYRPLTIWTLAVNHWVNTWLGLPGDHVVMYRVTGVVLHAGVCGLVFVFVRWLGFAPLVGLWAGLLFSVLPIHTEAVAVAVNRSEILALGFGLVFLMCYQRRWVWAGLCLFLALLSKESAVLFLPVAMWHMVTVQRHVERFLYWVGYGAVVGLWWVLRGLALDGVLQAVVVLDNPTVMASVWERVLTALAVQWRYIFLQGIPIGLSSDYSYHQIPVVQSIWTMEVWLFLGVLGVGMGWAWRVRQTQPWVPFLVGSYGVLFGLTSNVLFPIGTIMGERLAYAPSLCICILGGWGLTRLSRDWMWRMGGVLVVMYAGVAVDRLGVWQNAEVFYRAQVASAPHSAKAHYAVAHEVYQPAGALDKAVKHYQQAVTILPHYPDAWNNWGVIKKDLGDWDGAIEAYETALKWHDEHVAARVNLGQAFQHMGKVDAAIAAYERALDVDSTHAVAGNNLAILYAQHGDVAQAEVLFKRVLRHHPAYVPAQENYRLFLEAFQKP